MLACRRGGPGGGGGAAGAGWRARKAFCRQAGEQYRCRRTGVNGAAQTGQRAAPLVVVTSSSRSGLIAAAEQVLAVAFAEQEDEPVQVTAQVRGGIGGMPGEPGQRGFQAAGVAGQPLADEAEDLGEFGGVGGVQ